MESDEVLVKLYEEGNDAAFDVLLERHQSHVFNYILGSVHDEDLANDLFQEVFIKAITRIRSHRYVESGRFLSWVMRIAHNLIIDTFRRSQTFPTISGDDPEGPMVFNNPDLSDTNIENRLVTEQTYSDLAEMVSRLPEAQREVLNMRLYENLSFKEIAAKTNCSINTALGRMHYAVTNLRKMAAGRDLTIAM